MNHLSNEASAALPWQGDCSCLNARGWTDMWAWRMSLGALTLRSWTDRHAAIHGTSTHSSPGLEGHRKMNSGQVRVWSSRATVNAFLRERMKAFTVALENILSSAHDGGVRACASLDVGRQAQKNRGVDSVADWVCAVPCLALHHDRCSKESQVWPFEIGLLD